MQKKTKLPTNIYAKSDSHWSLLEAGSAQLRDDQSSFGPGFIATKRAPDADSRSDRYSKKTRLARDALTDVVFSGRVSGNDSAQKTKGSKKTNADKTGSTLSKSQETLEHSKSRNVHGLDTANSVYDFPDSELSPYMNAREKTTDQNEGRRRRGYTDNF